MIISDDLSITLILTLGVVIGILIKAFHSNKLFEYAKKKAKLHGFKSYILSLIMTIITCIILTSIVLMISIWKIRHTIPHPLVLCIGLIGGLLSLSITRFLTNTEVNGDGLRALITTLIRRFLIKIKLISSEDKIEILTDSDDTDLLK